jgi:hypothetical protein
MEDRQKTEEALEFFIAQEKTITKMRHYHWIAIFLGLISIGLFAYHQSRASDVADLSAQLTAQADSEAVNALLSLVDRKIALLKAELRFRDNFFGFIGGFLIVVGISGASINSYNLKKAKIMQHIVKKIGKNS